MFLNIIIYYYNKEKHVIFENIEPQENDVIRVQSYKMEIS